MTEYSRADGKTSNGEMKLYVFKNVVDVGGTEQIGIGEAGRRLCSVL